MDYEKFKSRAFEITGIDLTSYKQKQAERRIGTLLKRLGVDSFDAYCEILERDAKARKDFLNYFTINVTEFFRTPAKFSELENDVLPGLLKKGANSGLKIWSAGCSNGAEVYSLAIIMDELSPQTRHRFLATDIDDEMLKKAKEGVYGENEMGQVSKQRLAKYFQISDKTFILSDKIKSKVEFKIHDLLNDSFESEFDLILCRNVVIYFTEEAKDKLYIKFYNALRKGGVLFVGGTERIPNYTDIGFKSLSPFFYQK